MKRILVTGIDGFVGHHLTDALLAQELDVIGLAGPHSTNSLLKDKISSFHALDLTDPHALDVVDFAEVDGVIHLAGLASQAYSYDHPQEFIAVNSSIFINLMEALGKQKVHPRVVVISSGAIYDGQQAMPLTESSRLFPGSPYAASKILVENMATYYDSKGEDCIVVRPFNHIGPGQGPGFLLPDLYEKMVEAAKTNGKVVVGNVNTKRDYTDVRDIVRGYVDLVTAPSLSSRLFNICSGVSRAGTEIFELLLQTMGLQGRVNLETDPKLYRPNNAEELFGSNQQLHQETGWQPAIPLEKTIEDFVLAQRAKNA